MTANATVGQLTFTGLSYSLIPDGETATITTTKAVATGTVVFVVVASTVGNSAISSVTDSASNTYALSSTVTLPSSSTISVYFALLTSALPVSSTITVTTTTAGALLAEAYSITGWTPPRRTNIPISQTTGTSSSNTFSPSSPVANGTGVWVLITFGTTTGGLFPSDWVAIDNPSYVAGSLYFTMSGLALNGSTSASVTVSSLADPWGALIMQIPYYDVVEISGANVDSNGSGEIVVVSVTPSGTYLDTDNNTQVNLQSLSATSSATGNWSVSGILDPTSSGSGLTWTVSVADKTSGTQIYSQAVTIGYANGATQQWLALPPA